MKSLSYILMLLLSSLLCTAQKRPADKQFDFDAAFEQLHQLGIEPHVEPPSRCMIILRRIGVPFVVLYSYYVQLKTKLHHVLVGYPDVHGETQYQT